MQSIEPEKCFSNSCSALSLHTILTSGLLRTTHKVFTAFRTLFALQDFTVWSYGFLDGTQVREEWFVDGHRLGQFESTSLYSAHFSTPGGGADMKPFAAK